MIMADKLRHFISRPFLLLLFVFPVIGAGMLGGLLEKQQKELSIPIAMVDQDGTSISMLVAQRMEEQSRISVRKTSMEQAESLLARNEIDSIFVLEKGFEEKLLKGRREESIGLWTSPSSAASGIVREVVASEVTRITSAIKAADRVEKLYKKIGRNASRSVWQDAFDYADGQWEPEPLMTIHYQSGKEIRDAEPGESAEVFFVPYLGLWSFFTLLASFLACEWVVKERGVLFARISATERGISSYIRQTSGAYALLLMLQAAASFFLFVKMDWIEGSLELLGCMLLFVLFGVVLALFLASRIRHLGSYYVTGTLLVFFLSIVGGSFFPFEAILPSFGRIAMWFPNNLLVKSAADASGWWKQAAVMAGAVWLLWRTTLWGLRAK